MLRAAIAGVGFMGWIHYLAYQRSSHAMLDAFCSRNPAKRAGDWTSIKGNFGPPGEMIPLHGLKVYADLDEILNDPDIDRTSIESSSSRASSELSIGVLPFFTT